MRLQMELASPVRDTHADGIIQGAQHCSRQGSIPPATAHTVGWLQMPAGGVPGDQSLDQSTAFKLRAAA
jgi:hypothetical protein